MRAPVTSATPSCQLRGDFDEQNAGRYRKTWEMILKQLIREIGRCISLSALAWVESSDPLEKTPSHCLGSLNVRSNVSSDRRALNTTLSIQVDFVIRKLCIASASILVLIKHSIASAGVSTIGSPGAVKRCIQDNRNAVRFSNFRIRS